MALVATPDVQESFTAPDFSLTGIDGKTYTLNDVRGENGLVVMFICNHCPYVKGIMDRLPQDMAALQARGIGVIAIMSNDTADYPEDSFDNMRMFSLANSFSFPYVIDETQEIARKYGAVCTPDFFGFDSNLNLKYRGRLDSNGKDPYTSDARKELVEAMAEIASNGNYSGEQKPSMGCSIKWKN